MSMNDMLMENYRGVVVNTRNTWDKKTRVQGMPLVVMQQNAFVHQQLYFQLSKFLLWRGHCHYSSLVCQICLCRLCWQSSRERIHCSVLQIALVILAGNPKCDPPSLTFLCRDQRWCFNFVLLSTTLNRNIWIISISVCSVAHSYCGAF